MLSRRLLNISKAPLRRFLSNARQIPTTAIGRKRLLLIGLGATALTVGASITRQGAEAAGWFSKDDKKDASAASSNKEYTLAEVAKHRTAENRIWVTYQNNVYDITEFIEQHPGGSEKIIMAAGSDLAPFWNMYQQHQKPEVKAMLEPYKIGVVAAADRKSVAPQPTADPYKNEPERHPALRVVSAKPFNAETPNAAMGTFIVPNELFFVRNHLPTPVVDGAKYTLEIGGDGVRKVTLSLDELKSRFPKHTVISAIQCAGNRRTEMNKIKQVKGLDWHAGAISNATWGGVRLRDVLVYAGFDPSAEVKHIQFEGLDKDPAGMVYGGSIPLDKAMDAHGDVLLAYEMNGQELPRDHGYPIRVVAPGIVGARQVKWLSKIVASKNESPSHWQQNDYKGFNPNVDWNNVDFKSAPAIQDLPVQSAIIQPRDGSPLPADADEVTVKGYAYSGGGRAIVRVDVTADGGKNWHTAQLMTPPDYQPQPGRAWAWTPWQATVPLPKDRPDKVELACKAVDSSYNVQPDTVAPIWNLRGVLNNAWHRVSMGQSAQAQAQHADKEKPKTS